MVCGQMKNFEKVNSLLSTWTNFFTTVGTCIHHVAVKVPFQKHNASLCM